MFSYTQAAMERAMKVQEVILRAMAKKITWWQAAEIIGISDRQMRRWRERYEGFGVRGLLDRRRGKPSPKRVAMAVVEKVLGPYREKYFDLNVRQNPDGTTGIRLHVECGADCVMNPLTGELWGAHSQAHSLVHTDDLGTSSGGVYDWTAFQSIESAKFSPSARAPVFHYVVWAHNLGGLDFHSKSGISGVPASDFIVSLGLWYDHVGTTLQQAGTFMHELGHNLSLRHGGSDDINYKPNYLSVMNYLFQTNGLIIGGAPGDLDYSRFLLPNLNENNLDENVGLNGGAGLSTYGTAFYCAGAAMTAPIVNANRPIDWNCNGDNNEIDVSAEINSGVDASGAYQNDASLDTLTSFNDWPHLVYNGGAIGALGLAASFPTQTASQQELTQEMDSHLTKLLGVAVAGSGTLEICGTQIFYLGPEINGSLPPDKGPRGF